MSKCLNGNRRGAFARAAFEFLHARGLDVKFGKNTYGFTLAKWRQRDEDYHRFPGFYVYCSSDDPSHAGLHEDFICFDSPHKWPFLGDLASLNIEVANSFWRPNHNYIIRFLNRAGACTSATKFREDIGERIVAIFEALELSEQGA